MRALLALAALVLAVGCSSATATTPTASLDDLATPPVSASPPAGDLGSGAPEARLSATTTVAEPQEAPEPEPAEDNDPGSMPSIEKQIDQCIEQTGLPQACEDKIRYGIP